MSDLAPDRARLSAAKDRVSDQYLGRLGINSVGFSSRECHVLIYVTSSDAPELVAELRAIQALAQPFNLRVEESDQATLLNATFASPAE